MLTVMVLHIHTYLLRYYVAAFNRWMIMLDSRKKSPIIEELVKNIMNARDTLC